MANVLTNLQSKLEAHKGVFICSLIGDENKRSEFEFEHNFEDPIADLEVPNLGKLREFYNTFGSLTLFCNADSRDSAVFFASPMQWSTLRKYFMDWINDLDEVEREELVPEWVSDCQCIGEIPESGNYFLTPVKGNKAGYIYEFEHDGFEFIQRAQNIEDFIEQYLAIDSDLLTEVASHMRFVTDDPAAQWWIEEMRDNRGNIVKTEQ